MRLGGTTTLGVERILPETGAMFAVDIVEFGQTAHYVVLGLIVVGFLVIAQRQMTPDSCERAERGRRLAALGSVVTLFGGAFRVTPLDTTGRLLVAGASLAATFTLVALAAGRSELIACLRRSGPLRWMLAYGVAALPSIAVASDPLAAAGAAAGLMALVVVTATLAVRFDRQELGRLVLALAAAAVVVALSSAFLTPSEAIWTIRSPVLSQRFVGWFPFVGLGWGHLGVGLVILGLERPRWQWWGIASGLTLIAATQARGAAVALLAVGVLWVALTNRRFLPVIGVALVFSTVVGLTVDPVRDIWDREQSLEEADSIFSYRADYVRAALGVAETSPIIGRGIDSGTVDEFSERLTVGRVGRVESTTMAWMTALAGTGAVGLFFLLGTFGSAWRWSFRRWRTDAVRWPLLTMAWMTSSSFFIVGPSELTAQAVVFAVVILAPAAGEGFSRSVASSPGDQPGFVASQ